MRTRVNLPEVAVLLTAAGLAFYACCGPLHALPPNYDSVKQQLAGSIGFDPPPTAEQAAERSLQLSADQSVPALKALFGKNTDDQYRTAIVGIFYYATQSQEGVAAFLLDQVTSSPEMKGTDSKFRGQT